MKTPFLFLLVFAVARCACAQQAAPSPGPAVRRAPDGPLLNPVPDNTRWTITVTSKGAANDDPEESDKSEEKGKSGKKAHSGKGSGRTKAAKSGDESHPDTTTITGEKAGKTVHVLTVTADGAKVEKWTDGKLTATLTAGEQEPVFATNSVEPIPMPSWVSRSNYVETRTEDKKPCLFFRDRIVPATVEQYRDYENSDPAGSEKLKVEATALIEDDARLPVIVTEGTRSTAYKFEPLEPGTEIIPAAILSALQERGQKLEDASRPPARP